MTVLVGLLAAALTTGAWLPQIWRTWRTRSAADLSWGYLASMGLGFAMWLAYGLLTGDLAVLVANVTTLVLVSGLTVLKLRTLESPPVPEPVLEPAA